MLLTLSCFPPPHPPLRVHHRHTTRTGASSPSPSTLPGRQQVLLPTHSSIPQTLPPCQATCPGLPPTSPPGQQRARPGERVQPVSSGGFLPISNLRSGKITKERDFPLCIEGASSLWMRNWGASAAGCFGMEKRLAKND